MPAAAVIPAPIGYIKVVAVEKLVVVFVASRCGGLAGAKALGSPRRSPFCGPRLWAVQQCPAHGLHSVTESKLECSKQALQL